MCLNKLQTENDLYIFLYLPKIRCVYLHARMAYAHIWDSCDVITDHLVPPHREERNVDKLGLGFDFRDRTHHSRVDGGSGRADTDTGRPHTGRAGHSPCPRGTWCPGSPSAALSTQM